MMLVERQLRLNLRGFKQRANVPESPGAFGVRTLAGLVELREGMTVG
jgi:hypothetical protein